MGVGEEVERKGGAQALGVAPTERLKARMQMAAAAGKDSTLLTLVLADIRQEVEEQVATMALPFSVLKEC